MYENRKKRNGGIKQGSTEGNTWEAKNKCKYKRTVKGINQG